MIKERLDTLTVPKVRKVVRSTTNAQLTGSEGGWQKLWDFLEKELGEGCFGVQVLWFLPGRIGVLNFKEDHADGTTTRAYQRFRYHGSSLTLIGHWMPGEFRIEIGPTRIRTPTEKSKNPNQLELPFAAS